MVKASPTLPNTMAAAAETTDWGQVGVLHWQGQPLQVRQLGCRQDPPLVLIHGFAAAAGHWRANAPAFAAAGWRVHGVDLLGFGASAQPFLVQDNRTWAQQVLHLVEQRIQEPVVIVGHSLGALVGLTAAVSRPELVKALVLAPLQDPTLLKPPGPRRRQPFRPFRRRWQQLLRLLQRWLVPWGLILWLFSRPWLLAPGAAGGLQTASPPGPGHPAPVCPSLSSLPGAARSLAGMTMGYGRPPATSKQPLHSCRGSPALCCSSGGQEDRLAPQAHGRKPWSGCALICRSRSWRVAATAPPHDEDPKRFNGMVLAWLRKTLSS